MANRGSVPKFGAWDSDNVGYTVYFEKVRENKGATAPPLLHGPSNPNDPEEDAPRLITPPSRPATSSGHRAQHHGVQHRRAGSSSSVASDVHRGGARGSEREQSKFAPPPQFHQRQQQGPHYHGHHHSPAGHGGGHHHHHHSPGGGHGGGHHLHSPGGGHGGGHHLHHAQQAGPRDRSASPQNNRPSRRRPSTVPKFGVWDEQSASAAAQGFTVQFDNLKRHREKVRGAVPDVSRSPSPEGDAAGRRSRHTPFVSKMFGCFASSPTTRD